MNAPSHRRRGLASVVVLVILVIIGLVCAGLLKVAFGRRAEVGMQERLLQAGSLSDSGMDRALARLSSSSDYPGEAWEVPATDLGGRGAALVTIRVEPVADQPAQRKVRVQADYPKGSGLQVRRSRETIVDLKPPAR